MTNNLVSGKDIAPHMLYVLEFVDSCTTSLNDKIYTIAVFLDLSKAFDTFNKDLMFPIKI